MRPVCCFPCHVWYACLAFIAACVVLSLSATNYGADESGTCSLANDGMVFGLDLVHLVVV